MTFAFFGFEPGPTGSVTSKTLILIYPPADIDELPPNFTLDRAKQEVEAIFRTLIDDPSNRDLSYCGHFANHRRSYRGRRIPQPDSGDHCATVWPRTKHVGSNGLLSQPPTCLKRGQG